MTKTCGFRGWLLVLPLFLLKICGKLLVESHESFSTACDIHDSTKNQQYDSSLHSSHALAKEVQFNDSWLYGSHDEIKKWYSIGMAECQNYLLSDDAKSSRESKLIDFPNPYVDGSNLPPAGNLIDRC